jgi:CubicO group peptidase (beta-lactamase class C family)
MRFFLLPSVFLGLVVQTAPAGEPLTPAAADEIVQEALRRWEVPGAAVAIVSAGKPPILKGYGKCELGGTAPVTADTLFPLASCTKAFTATAIAALVDDGKMSWDDPVRKHLPQFHLADPNADQLVTIRDLLCHRTGVGGHDLLWYRAPWGQDESIRRIGKTPLSGPFRASFAYQSIMFMAAGKAAGAHHPEGWAGLVRSRLLQPLEMKQTCLSDAEAGKAKDRARGHRPNREGKIEVYPDYPIPEPNPAGSVFTTARDLANWLKFQVGDRNWDRKRIVSPENLAETHKPQSIIPMDDAAKRLTPLSIQLTYAMGWVVQDYRGEKMLTHSGWIDGYRVQLTLLPEKKFGLAILSNLHATRMNLAVTNRLVDLFLGGPVKDWNSYYLDLVKAEETARATALRDRDRWRDPAVKPSLPLSSYAGEYEHPAYGICQIKEESGRLVWEWSSFKEPLEPFRGDVFEIRNLILGDPLLDFQGSSKGVTGLKVLEVEFKKK